MANLSKVVLFSSELVNPGGAERLMVKEAKYLEMKGIKSKILTFKLNKRALFGYENLDVEVINAKNPVSKILSLRRKLKDFRPDLIISQSYWDSEFLYLATLSTKIPYITHIHGTPFWFDNRLDLRKYGIIYKKVFNEIRNSLMGHREFIPTNPKISMKDKIKLNMMAILNYLAVRKSKKIIVLTSQIKWEVKKLYDMDAIVSRGCLDAELLSYNPKRDIKKDLGFEDKYIILSIGRLDLRKRIDVLVKAFSKLYTRYKDVFLLIGGIGEEEEKLKKLVKDLHIEDRVKFLGFIPDDELFDYYAACDVFAFPSWTTSGITPYEALALEKKVVWTSEADEPVLTDKHVFVANPTVNEFAEALEEAINTEVKEKIDLSNYTWDKYFERVYKICEEIINRK